ncbi:MAG: UDP-N-acetylmuramoyl-L-alanyl-D-glutamate--2,6-diaminopimelate ligase [Nitrospirota bacterium]
MILNEILKDVDYVSISGNAEADIKGISYDSRKVSQGDIFVAVSGEKVDGHDFIDDAVRKGAGAVVHEKSGKGYGSVSGTSFILVKDSRKALAYISNNFFLRPSEKLSVVGVTGTNGKTTTTYLLKSILETWGKKVGLIGTIQYMIKDEVYDAVHTTPEALEFQDLLHHMHASGCNYVVSEVSSHALAQKRVDGTVFSAGVFTNLTRDHLDFHKTMEEYFRAKKRLFDELLDKKATSIINYDDIWGRKLIEAVSGNVFTCGLEIGSDIMATEIDNTFDGLRFKIIMHGRTYNIISRLMGLPNVYNILSAAGAAFSLGVPWDIILDGIKKTEPIRGRFEKVDMGQKFLAVIDYAHTEDALERLIFTARGLTKGKIITVFGCGGDRDRGKRPKMGAVATRLSDFVIITSDNPRSEEPGEIIKEIEAGAVRRNYLVEPDRRDAVKRSVVMASEGDIVIIAGKGHETYQDIGGKRFKFSDREVLAEAIRQLINNS